MTSSCEPSTSSTPSGCDESAHFHEQLAFEFRPLQKTEHPSDVANPIPRMCARKPYVKLNRIHKMCASPSTSGIMTRLSKSLCINSCDTKLTEAPSCVQRDRLETPIPCTVWGQRFVLLDQNSKNPTKCLNDIQTLLKQIGSHHCWKGII